MVCNNVVQNPKLIKKKITLIYQYNVILKLPIFNLKEQRLIIKLTIVYNYTFNTKILKIVVFFFFINTEHKFRDW